MSTYLYRLGHWAFRRRWIVLAFWVGLLVAVGAISQAVKKPTNDAFNVPGTESQRALDLPDEKFPGSGGATAEGQISLLADYGVTPESVGTEIRATMEVQQIGWLEGEDAL